MSERIFIIIIVFSRWDKKENGCGAKMWLDRRSGGEEGPDVFSMCE